MAGYLLRVSDAWYSNTCEAVQLLYDATLVSNRPRYHDLNQSVRDLLGTHDVEDWETVHETVKINVENRIKYINDVYQMLVSMDISDREARALITIFMTNDHIDEEIRHSIVTSWKDVSLLSEFRDDALLPIRDGSSIMPDRAGKVVEFTNYLRRCLPLSSDMHDLERHLCIAQSDNDRGRLKRGLLNASGITDSSSFVCERPLPSPVDCSLPQKQQTVPASTKNTKFSPPLKQACTY